MQVFDSAGGPDVLLLGCIACCAYGRVSSLDVLALVTTLYQARRILHPGKRDGPLGWRHVCPEPPM